MTHQVIQHAQAFFHGRLIVEAMQEIDVDAVGIEALKAGFDGLHEVPPRCPTRVDVRAGGEIGLRGQNHVVAVPCALIGKLRPQLPATRS